MIRIGSVFACWLLLLGHSTAEEKPSLKDYAAKLQGRHAYGVYVQNQKIGWMVSDTKLGKHDGKDVLISKEEMFAEIKRGGSSVTMDIKESSIYALTGDGDLLVHEERNKDGKVETVTRGVRKADKFVITVSSDADNPRTVEPPRRNLLQTRKLDDWLRSGPKKDSKFETWGISYDETDINVKEEYTFKAKKTLKIGGVDTDIYHVLTRSKGAVSESDILSDGTPIKGSLAGFLDVRSEPEAIAKKLNAVNLDLLDLSSIRSDKELGNPETVESLTLTVTGLGDYAMPTSHRQVLKSGEDKMSVTLELKRDFKADKAEPLTEAQRKVMLSATPRIQSELAKVKALTKEIVGEETDVHKKAKLIKAWVYRKLDKSFSENPNTTAEVLKRMAGDCKHHTLLFVALARASGIPAREVGGVGYCGPGSKAFGWHAWAEYHDGHQWVSIDPTWDEDRVDATHVKFSDSAEDMAWVNVLGKVKFKVVDVKKK